LGPATTYVKMVISNWNSKRASKEKMASRKARKESNKFGE